MSAVRLPVADAAAVRRRVGALLAEHRAAVAGVALAQLAAAAAGVAIPRVLGEMVDVVGHGGPGAAGRLHGLIAVVVALAAANALLTGGGEYLARILGERVFAELRERLVAAALRLPLSVVESAGTGDLLGRTSHDLESIRFVVRRGVSQILVIVLTIVSVTAAALLTSPALGACMLVAAVLAVPSPGQLISRNHLLIELDEWSVLARNLSESNGTLLLREGEPARKIPSSEPVLLRAGDVLDLGDGQSLAMEDLP